MPEEASAPGPSVTLGATPEGYGQMCAISMALDDIGARWNLLILRDLARTPLRFSDLAAINPGLSPSMLTRRLRSLEAAGIIEKRSVRAPANATLYAIVDTLRGPIGDVLSSIAELGTVLLEANPPADDPSAALAAQMELNGHYVMARGSDLQGYFVFDLSGWVNHIVVTDTQFLVSADAPTGGTPDATATFFPPTTLLRIMGRTQTIAEAEDVGFLAIDGDRNAMLELIRLLSFGDPTAP